MDAKDYYKSGKEHFEKGDYAQAITEFWKGLDVLFLIVQTAFLFQLNSCATQ